MSRRSTIVARPRLSLAQLTAYDDILTDSLIDHAFYWTTIRKMRKAYHASRGLSEEEVSKIIQQSIIVDKDPVKAEARFLTLPALRRFVDTLATEKEKDDFRKHLRRYINIYLPDCPFEVASTNRFTVLGHEAAVVARRSIRKGETVKYLCGVQVVMTPEEEDDIKFRRQDFSVVISSKNKSASLFLGPARFSNHDCDANARLMTHGHAGMEIIAARDIRLGEEITVSYGDHYFGEDNSECLCKTCEDRCAGGWTAPDCDNEVITVQPTIELDTMKESNRPLTRKRRRDDLETPRNESATPDLRPLVHKRTPKKLSRPSLHMSSPADSRTSDPVEVSGASSPLRLWGQTIGADDSKSGQDIVIKEEEPLGAHYAVIYVTPRSSPGGCSPSKRIPGPAEEVIDQSQAPQLPVVFENSIAVPPKRGRGRPRKIQPELQQMKNGAIVLRSASTNDSHLALEDSTTTSTSVKRLTRPTNRLLKRTLSTISMSESTIKAESIRRAKRQKMRPATPEPVVKQRTPGDYVLTPLLLAQPASAWISCQNCDGYFVQLEAYNTRSSCPRCERHSKLYGYRWPKTEKESVDDDEERVLDHRTVHRFVPRAIEKLVRRRDRGYMSDSGTETSVEKPCLAEVVAAFQGRRSGRVRKVRDMFS